MLDALTPHALPHHADPRASEGRHDTRITALAFSRDSTLLASATTNRILVWRLMRKRSRSGRKRIRLMHAISMAALLNEEHSITALAFSPDTATLASASTAGVHLWSTTSGEQVPGPRARHARPYHTITYSNDHLLAAAGEGGLSIWDATHNCLHSSDEATNAVAFNPTTNAILIITSDRIDTRDPRSGALEHTAPRTNGAQHETIAISADTTLAASTPNPETAVIIWDTRTATRLHRLHRADCTVALAFTPDGTILACSGLDDITLWDTRTGRKAGRLKPDARMFDTTCNTLTFSPNSHTLATAITTSHWYGDPHDDLELWRNPTTDWRQR